MCGFWLSKEQKNSVRLTPHSVLAAYSIIIVETKYSSKTPKVIHQLE